MSDAAPVFEWAQMCSQELRFAVRGSRIYAKRGWAVSGAYWSGEEWRIPMVRSINDGLRQERLFS